MHRNSEDMAPLSGAMADLRMLDDHGKKRRPESPLTSFLDNLTASKNVNIVNDNAKSKSLVRKMSLTSQESKKGNERWIPIAFEASPDDATSSLEEDSQTDLTDQTPQSSSDLLPINDSSDSKSSGKMGLAKDAIRTRSVSAPSIPQRKNSDDPEL
jgi:hypothetical protein